jgi:uncharacterized repeat protein (TIGR02543 family)
MDTKNLLLKLFCLMLCISAAKSSFAQEENFTQEKPVWKCLFLLYPNVDIDCTGTDGKGTINNGVKTFSDALCDSLWYKAEGFKWYVEESTHHRIEIQFDTCISFTPVEKLQNTGYGDACAVVPDFDKERLGYNDYDVVFITANHRNSHWSGLAWGRDGQNGPLKIILVNFLADKNGWTAFGHEWSHSYMQAQSGKAHISPGSGWADSYDSFGYNADNQAGNPWFAIHPHAAFYHDIMEGTLQNYTDHDVVIGGRFIRARQKYLGTHPSLWRYTRKNTYPEWDLRNSFITSEYEECSGRVLLYDQNIPMVENTDYTAERDENGIITVTGINDYTGTLTVTATSTPVTHDVIFETYGGTAVASQQLYCHSSVSDPGKIFKDDFIFGGWFKDEEFKNEWDFYADTTPDADITIYAKWIPLSGGNFINLSEENPPATGDGWTYENGTYTIIDGATVTISGETSTKNIVVAENAKATIILEDATVDASSIGAALQVTGADVTLILLGRNELKGSQYHAGIEQALTGTLTIESDIVAPECDCIGAGIYPNYGTLYAFGGQYAAGIGGAGFTSSPNNANNSCGTIIINGGIIFATGTASRGAGIGGGRDSKTGNIIINGGIIAAIGINPGAAIGRGRDGTLGSITINGGTVYADAWAQGAITNGKTTAGVETDVKLGPNAVVFMTSATTPFKGVVESGAVVRSEITEGASYLAVLDYSLTMSIKEDMTIPAGSQLGVPPRSTITVGDDVELNNNGWVLAGKINGVEQTSDFDVSSNYGDIENWYVGQKGNINVITEIPEISTSSIKVYSAGKVLNIEANDRIKRIAITDISGRTLLTKTVAGTSATVSTNTLTKGIYLVLVETISEKITKKIIL